MTRLNYIYSLLDSAAQQLSEALVNLPNDMTHYDAELSLEYALKRISETKGLLTREQERNENITTTKTN